MPDVDEEGRLASRTQAHLRHDDPHRDRPHTQGVALARALRRKDHEVYLHADVTEKLAVAGSIVPPSLKRGRFRLPTH